MILRQWTYEDVYDVAKAELVCFSDPWTFQMLADTFFGENTLTVIAEEDGKKLGYAFLICAGDDADLANVAVLPEFRRRKAAEKMLIFLETQALKRGVKRIFLEVRVSNAAAMSLYLKLGYVGRYVRPKYYGDGEDAVVMSKELGKTI